MTNKSTNPLIQNNFALKKLEVGLAMPTAQRRGRGKVAREGDERSSAAR